MKKFLLTIATGAVLSLGLSAWGDSVSIRAADAPPTAKPIEYPDVTVTGVSDGKITFQTDNGAVSKDFATVVGLKLKDEPAFNDAEAAFDAGKFDQAVDKYDQTMNKTDKPWLKDYCVTKLADAANKSGRFDKAVDSFIVLVKKNPALAAKHKPTPPENGSTYLDGAAQTLNKAVDDPDLKDDQIDMLLDLLLAVQQARKDDAAVVAIAKRLGHAADAQTPGDTRAVAPSGAQVDARLAEIHTLIDQKKFDDAVTMINSSEALFPDPAHRDELFWMLAEAREGQATAKATDNTAWKDAAIAYMRVVADYKTLPGKPHVADSLMHTAAILEKLNLNKEAIDTYLSVVKDFTNDPQAVQAQKEADRLKAAPNLANNEKLSMNKFIRTHQKKLLALFSAFLMVVFMLPSSFKNGRGGGATEHVVGTIGKTNVTAEDLQQAANAWRELSKFYYQDPQRDAPEDMSIVEFTLGREVAGEISKMPNGETFYLLGEEARKAGVVVSDDEVTSLIKNNLFPPVQDPDQIDQLKPAVGQLLSIQGLLNRDRRIVKTSQPRIDLILAQQRQQLGLNVLLYPADEYLAAVGQPTPEQIKTQYDTFSDRLPDQFGASGDTLGFGYKYPDRVKVQYIGVKEVDVSNAAKASKSELDWDQAAFAEFKNNRDEYDGEDVPVATTQPTSQPALTIGGVSIQPAAPTTRMAPNKLKDLTDDFELHHELVLNRLYAQETKTLRQTIVKKISDTMAADYTTWSDAQSATTQPASSLGPPYGSYLYIDALAEIIQSQYKVIPVKGEVDRFESSGELAQVRDIGKASLALVKGPALPFAQYATYIKGLAMGTTNISLAPLQISYPVQNGNDTYLFRATTIDPSHTAALDEIKPQVIRDWRLNQAYQQATDAARKTLALAQTGGLEKAAIRMGRPSVTTTEKFEVDTVINAGEDAKILPLLLKPMSAAELAAEAAKLLATPAPSPNLRPVSLVELYPDAIAGVIELDQANPTWKPGTGEMFKSLNLTMITQSQATQLATDLASYPSVAARLNYQPAKR